MQDRHSRGSRPCLGLGLQLLLLLSSVCVDATSALTIDVDPVERLASPPSPDEVLEQIWTGAATPSGELSSIQELLIDTFSQVYVSHLPGSSLATNKTVPLFEVRVSGSDFKLITAVDVVPSPSGQGIQIQQRNTRHIQKLEGYVGIEVTLFQPSELQRLNVNGTSDVIVLENVLVSSAPQADIEIKSSGAGSLYLPRDLNMAVRSLSVAVRGNGSVYLPSAHAIVAPVMAFSTESSGQFVLSSQTMQAQFNITARTSGAGDLCIDANHVETNVIHARQLGGSGRISIGHSGSSDAALCYQNGVGSIDLGTVLCTDVDVQLHGSGNVTVHSARSLTGYDYGTGAILYAGDTPNEVADIDPWAYIKYPIAYPDRDYHTPVCGMVPEIPVRALTRIYKTSATGSHSFFTTSRVVVLVGFLVCLGACYVLEARRQRAARRRHHGVGERTPLLRTSSEETAVYV